MVRGEQIHADGAREPPNPPAGPAEVPAVRLTSWEPICYEIYEMLCNCEEPKDRLS